MAAKHYMIATQNGYLVDNVTGYPYEFHSKEAAVKALAEEVKTAAQECRRSHKSCSVVGSARSGSVQIKIGGCQGYHLWQRYVINERPGSRKSSSSSFDRELKAIRAAAVPSEHHSTIKSTGTYVVKSFRDRGLAQEMPTLALAKGTARDLARMPLRWKKEEARYGSADSPIRTTYYSDGDYYIELR